MRRVHVGEEIDPRDWAALPISDRLMVGGRTTWLQPRQSRPPVVPQPNRWGQVEETFPAVPCVVEADPLITGLLPLPADVVGWVDRMHRPLERPVPTGDGRRLLEAAGRLAKVIDQVAGIRLLAHPRGRTVAFITPMETMDVLARCAPVVAGMRPLAGLAGGLAVVVRPEHSDEDLTTVASQLREALVERS